ncbi:MAG: AlpA family phage regulatory protein [Gemmatimonadota bacterium]|nr:AlpA family phage regulatory protein [Gemmatimonadota bacterium]
MTAIPAIPRLLRRAEVEAALGLSTASVYRLMAEGIRARFASAPGPSVGRRPTSRITWRVGPPPGGRPKRLRRPDDEAVAAPSRARPGDG